MENKPVTVLVIDDDEAVRMCHAAMLRKNGFATLEAPDGAEAIRVIREHDKEISALLSDLRMPYIDGLKLAEWNFLDGFRPFIACTAVSDAAEALRFLKFGVRDYVTKPTESAALVNAVQRAICRRKLPHLFADDETPLPGNMGIISIPAQFAAMARAQTWLGQKINGILPQSERKLLLNYVSEFLMNAYEHGSLLLTEAEKSGLIVGGGYLDELRRREQDCKAMIEVAVSIVGDEIAIKITDDGFGFDHKRYMKMPEDEMIDRMTMPNGRGIHMAAQYFDRIAYSKGGASVLLIKKSRGK